MKNIKKIGKVIILMISVILLTFTFAGFLKWFGINEGPLTKIVPFSAMLIGTVVFLKLIDKKNFYDIDYIILRRYGIFQWQLFYCRYCRLCGELLRMAAYKLQRPLILPFSLRSAIVF